MERCIGCGALLQTKNKQEIGYIPKEKKETAKVCERCFRLIHYNDLKLVNLKKVNDVIATVNQKGKFAFFLGDLLNINSEVIKTYKDITIPKCFVLSKVDVIPKYINKEKIKYWLKKEYQINEEILFLSALKSQNIHVIESVMTAKNISVSYLLGYTNSGKSTLINKLIDTNTITTSLVPNTTADFIPISLENNKTIIDSPGFLYHETLYDQNDIILIKKINPKTFLKPLTFQLKKGASILIENLIRLENKSDKCNITIYMSNLLDIKKIYEKNPTLKDAQIEEYNIKRNQDIVIKGLGFINCKSTACLKIYVKKKGFVEIRNSFFQEV